MCAPGVAAIAGIGMGIMQAGASAGATNADYAAKSAAWQQNIINAESADRDRQRQIIGNQLSEQGKYDQQIHQSLVTQFEKSGRVAAAASSGNVAGISVDNILQDISRKSLDNRTNADLNYKYVVADTQNKLTASVDQDQSQINSVARPQSPNGLAEVAGIGGSLVKGFGALSGGGPDSGGSVSFGDG